MTGVSWVLLVLHSVFSSYIGNSTHSHSLTHSYNLIESTRANERMKEQDVHEVSARGGQAEQEIDFNKQNSSSSSSSSIMYFVFTASLTPAFMNKTITKIYVYVVYG